MKDVAVILAQTLGFTKVESIRHYVPDLIKAFQDRYEFVVVPRTPAEMLPTDKPLFFEHGKFKGKEGSFLISKVEIYAQGFLVETKSSTDDCDLVMRDILPISMALGFTNGEAVGAYISQLEVVFEAPFTNSAPVIERVGNMLGKSLRTPDGGHLAAFQIHSIGMSIDPAKGGASSEFRIERRLGRPWEDQAFFSQAPLSTAKHIEVLNAFEQSLIGI